MLSLNHWTNGADADAGDYAQYLLHANAIERGNSYTDIGFIINDYNIYIGPEAEPPGLPMSLYIIKYLFGDDIFFIKLFLFIVTLAFLLISTRYFHYESRLLAMLTLVLLALSPTFAFYSTQILADIPFMASLWIVFLLVDRHPRWSRWDILSITLFGILAILFRTAAVAIIPAMLMFSIFHYHSLKFKPLIPMLGWMATFCLMILILPVTKPAIAQINTPVYSLLSNFIFNIPEYRYAVFNSHLYPFANNMVNDVYHVITGLFFVIGVFQWLRSAHRSLLFWFSSIYTTMIFLLPITIARYLWILYPLFVYLALSGCFSFLRFLLQKKVICQMCVVVLVFTLGAATAFQTYNIPPPNSLVRHEDVKSLFRYIKNYIPINSSHIMFVKPRILTLHTEIPAMGLANIPATKLMDLMRKKQINYVVVGDINLFPQATSRLKKIVARHPEQFIIQYQNSSFSLYEFKPLYDALSET